MIEFKINGTEHKFEGDEETPLLWVLRDYFGYTGTKFGCGMAQCGACTVHLDGKAIRSCVKQVKEVAGHTVTTIEGLGTEGNLHPVQQAWLDENVPQCGFCQPGQIMAAAALLKANPKPNDAQVCAAMSGNICRCGTYPRIKKAIQRLAQK